MTEEDRPPLSAEARLIHAGTDRDLGAPAAPPLIPASVYASWGDPDPARAYGRTGNPGWEALEEALGVLEDADVVVFSSGQAAAMALMLALAGGLRSLLLPSDGYYNIRMLADWLRPYGAEPVPVDLLDLAEVERELGRGPALLWAETPTNPLLRVADLTALAGLATATGAPLVVDNTVATGLLQRPLDLGAVASLTSLTKSASGHSDVLLGAVATRDPELLAAVRGWRAVGGGIPGPFESWLVLRGLRTLALRTERQSENALGLARHLDGHPRVRAVHYPGTTAATLEIGPPADAARVRPAAVVRAGRHRRRRRRGGLRRPADPARDQLRRGGIDVGTAGPVGVGNRAGVADPAFGRDRTPG